MEYGSSLFFWLGEGLIMNMQGQNMERHDMVVHIDDT